MLKALMLRKKLNDVQKLLEACRAKADALKTREAELEQDINAAETEEEKQAVEAAIAEFETEKAENEAENTKLTEQVEELERELQETEQKANAPAPSEGEERARKELPIMENAITNTRTKEIFGKLSYEQRTAMFERDDVKEFMAEVRACIKEKRALSGVGTTIPEVYLGLIRENVIRYSKLYRHVNIIPLRGEGRMNIMGTVPEAVWTEMCANLNELDLSFYAAEVDGYKVGGFIPVCNANLDDSDIDLAAEIIAALGQAIGYALDKAILYGTGEKMPLGVITRLAQTSEPANYPAKARPWVDLHSRNIQTISSDLSGVAMYKALMTDAAKADGKYSRGEKVWVMNETTYTALKAEMLSINAAGAVVSGIDGTLPVIGGIVEVLNFMPDNVIIGGYFDLYPLAERAGTRIERSEHVKFLEDVTVFKGTARYDGLPVIAEAFVAIGINSTTPAASDVTFAEDTANPNAAGKLKSLKISGVTLNATFAPDTTTYTGTTTTATGTIEAVPQDGFDPISITYNDNNYVPNGGSVKWAAGAGNVVAVSVKDSTSGTVTTYTVTVTKS